MGKFAWPCLITRGYIITSRLQGCEGTIVAINMGRLICFLEAICSRTTRPQQHTLSWHGYFAFCMLFATFGHGCLPFCMVFCHALQHLICMVFATFLYSKCSGGFLESFFRVSFKGSYQDFLSGCPNVHVGSLGVHLGVHLGFL